MKGAVLRENSALFFSKVVDLFRSLKHQSTPSALSQISLNLPTHHPHAPVRDTDSRNHGFVPRLIQ